MKRWGWGTLLVVCLLFADEQHSKGQSYLWSSVTPQQATATVRTFAGDPTLPVTVTSVPSGYAPDAYVVYGLSAGRYNYGVGAFATTRFTRQDMQFVTDPTGFYGQPYVPSILRGQAMNAEAARSIADAFMRTHFPCPAVLGPAIVEPYETFDGTGVRLYSVVYRELAAPNVTGPSRCFMCIDSVRGQIVYYGAVYLPVLVTTTCALTPAQAGARLAASAGVASPYLLEPPVPSGRGTGRTRV